MVKVTKSFLNKLKKSPTEVLKGMSEDEIATLIQKANYSYYNTDEPLFSDNLFDMVKDYLENINPHNPILKHVGSTFESGKKEVLPHYMGSLDKIKADEKALEKFKKEFKGTYMVSDKLDGNSAMIHCKSGVVKLYSRGDGTVGQDISHILPFIRNVGHFEKYETTIRGEIIMSKIDFEKVKYKGANARNMVAGLINSKIPDLEIARLAQFVAYELITPIQEPEKQYDIMKKLGFKVVEHRKVSENKLTVDELSNVLVKRRDESEFEIDGIVVFHNAIHKRKTDENPKHAFAFKSVITMQKAEVFVTNVEWNLSKDGYLIPVINFNGVSLAGVTIKRAHGFNGKFIQDHKIGPGSKIIIMRSGDVIPYVTEVLSASETGQAQMPEDIQYVWTESGVDIKMSLEEQSGSDELRFKNVANFFEKIDVKGLSTGNLRKIYDSGFKTVKSIFSATKSDLLQVEGFQTKLAEKIASALEDRKNNMDCVTVMDASNTLGRGIGKKKIELILQHIPIIMTTRHVPSLTELLDIKGIEKKTATVFMTNLPRYFEFIDENQLQCTYDAEGAEGVVEAAPVYMSQHQTAVKSPQDKETYLPDVSQTKICAPPKYIEFVDTTNRQCIFDVSEGTAKPVSKSPQGKDTHSSTITSAINCINSNILKDRKIVFTGFRNAALEKHIKGCGGTVSSTISKSTSLVVRKDGNDKESSKVKKAEEFGIEVMNLVDFATKFNFQV